MSTYHEEEIDALEPYSLQALSLAPICQENCSMYWVVGTNCLLPIFLKTGCDPGSVEEAIELEFIELLKNGHTALLLDDEDNVRRVRYTPDWDLEIDGLVYSRDEELKEMGPRRLVRWLGIGLALMINFTMFS